MLEVLDHRVLGELTPLAEIDPANDLLYQDNIKFVPDDDEWGQYHIAAFRADDVDRPFAILQYKHDPKNKAHLFVFGDVPLEGLGIFIASIATALGLPPEAFHWRDEQGEMVSLVPSKAA